MIITPRLYMILITMKDTDDVFATMNSKIVAETISFMSWPMTMDQAENWCHRAVEGKRQDKEFLFIARDQKTHQPVACIGLHKKEAGVAEVGYWVSQNAHGQGYASELLKALLDFGFEKQQIKKFWATAALFNIGSKRVLEKNGFKVTGSKTVPTVKNYSLECNLFELQKT